MDEDECMICLEKLETDIAVLQCGHKYHFDCITQWNNKTHDLRKLCTICEIDNEIVTVYSIGDDTKPLPKINNYNDSNNQNKSRQCVIL